MKNFRAIPIDFALGSARGFGAVFSVGIRRRPSALLFIADVSGEIAYYHPRRLGEALCEKTSAVVAARRKSPFAVPAKSPRFTIVGCRAEHHVLTEEQSAIDSTVAEC